MLAGQAILFVVWCYLSSAQVSPAPRCLTRGRATSPQGSTPPTPSSSLGPTCLSTSPARRRLSARWVARRTPKPLWRSSTRQRSGCALPSWTISLPPSTGPGPSSGRSSTTPFDEVSRPLDESVEVGGLKRSSPSFKRTASRDFLFSVFPCRHFGVLKAPWFKGILWPLFWFFQDNQSYNAICNKVGSLLSLAAWLVRAGVCSVLSTKAGRFVVSSSPSNARLENQGIVWTFLTKKKLCYITAALYFQSPFLSVNSRWDSNS